ncbi:MAG: hypothetical protein V3R25_10065 [Nitrosomonadaceae bacterium]
MDKQYFSVGEVVILESVELPAFNGEHEVKSFSQNGDIITAECGMEWRCAASNSYFLSGVEFSDSGPIPWHPSALRKKHQGGEDFQSLMTELTKDKVAEQ